MKNCDLQISPLWLFKRVRVRMHDFKKLLLSLSSELYHSERLHVKEIKLGVKTGNEAVAQLLAIPHCRMCYIMQKKLYIQYSYILRKSALQEKQGAVAGKQSAVSESWIRITEKEFTLLKASHSSYLF